jgi:hypothetical protein
MNDIRPKMKAAPPIYCSMRLSDIVVGTRHRRDLGDIETLAQSIDQVGLLHLPVVDQDGRLIAGARRLKALEKLGKAETAVRIIDLNEIVRGEFAENAPSQRLRPFRDRRYPSSLGAGRKGCGQRTDE